MDPGISPERERGFYKLIPGKIGRSLAPRAGALNDLINPLKNAMLKNSLEH